MEAGTECSAVEAERAGGVNLSFLIGCLCGAIATGFCCLVLFFSYTISTTSIRWKRLQTQDTHWDSVASSNGNTRDLRWSSRKIQISLLAEGISQPLLFGLKLAEKLALVCFGIANFNIWMIFLFLRTTVFMLEHLFTSVGNQLEWEPSIKVALALSFIEEVLENIEMVTDVAIRASKMVVTLCFQTVIKVLAAYKFLSFNSLMQLIISNANKTIFDLQVLGALADIGEIITYGSNPILSELRLKEFICCLKTIGELHFHGEHEAKSIIREEPIVFETIENNNLIRRYVMFACAPYGQRALKFLGILPYGKHISNELAFCKLTGLSGPETIISAQWGGKIFQPGYVICVNQSEKAIILAVRGTFFPQDFLTDLVCKASPFVYAQENGYCHDGMLRSAQNLLCKLEPMLSGMLKRNEYEGFKVVLTGHSLGAGIASIMTALLVSSPEWFELAEIGKLHCFGYGTPCIFSPSISRSLEPFVTTVVMGNDMVPRFSLNSFQRLRDLVKQMWKEKGKADEIMQKLSPLQREQAGIDELKRVETAAKNTSWARETVSSMMDTFDSGVLHDHQPFLSPAGKIIWIDDQLDRSNSSETLNCTIATDPSSLFRDLIITNDMFSAHLPQNYTSLLAQQQYLPHF